MADSSSSVGPEVSGEQVPASNQSPIAVSSSSGVPEASNHRSTPIPPALKEGGLISRSVDNKPRDRGIPVRAAYTNRQPYNAIITNYEDAFGPVGSKQPSTPNGGVDYPDYNASLPLSPPNRPAGRELTTRPKYPAKIDSHETKGRSTGDMTTPANPKEAKNFAGRGSKRKSTSTQSEDLNAPPASRIRASTNPKANFPLEQPKITNSINLSTPQPLLTIFVGSGAKTQKFEIHRSVGMLSPFIYNSLKKSLHLGEKVTQTIRVPSVEGPTFGLVVNWLYTQNIELAQEERPLRLMEAAKLWVVAEIFLLPSLQNKAIAMAEMALGNRKGDAHSLTEEVEEFCHYAYEAGDESPLKQLALDHVASKIVPDTVHMWLNALPRGMQDDLTKALVKKLDQVPEHMFQRKPTSQYFVPEV